ncbi:MAG: hypothetical protein MUP52_09550 [Candidatus Aminicenantes bacterium]|nr:hypothetical protein [Candidatus Aminicenantes bacterium]
MPVEPKINISIPYEPEAALGWEYNRILDESKHEWVLFLDHDALILNPHWYHVCQEAIRKCPGAGLFTCFGSAGGCRFQRLKNAPARGQSILVHRQFAKDLWKLKKYTFSLVPDDLPGHLVSGFFMLTSRTAWKKSGGFGLNGMFAQDHLYHKRIKAAGFKTYRIDGIYCYHLLERADGSWIPNLKTSKELWEEYWTSKRMPIPRAR